jgi:hypothetical protein
MISVSVAVQHAVLGELVQPQLNPFKFLICAELAGVEIGPPR